MFQLWTRKRSRLSRRRSGSRKRPPDAPVKPKKRKRRMMKRMTVMRKMETMTLATTTIERVVDLNLL